MDKEKKQKIVITVGVFDCFHEGHFNLLNEMAKIGTKLIILVHDDYSTYLNKKRFTIQDINLRMRNVKKSLQHLKEESKKALDFKTIPVYDADPSTILEKRLFFEAKAGTKKGDIIYMRGDDWKDFPGKPLIEKEGIEIKYIPYTKGVSTTKRRNEII